MTSMNLLLRPSVREGRYPGSLSLRVIHNRKVKTIALPGCRLYPEEWDKERQEVVFPENNPRRTAHLEQVDCHLRNEMEILNNHLLELQSKGRYNVDDVVTLFRQSKDDGKLLCYGETLATILKERGQYRTANAYRTVTSGIVKFNKGVDIPLGQINACLIKDFEKHLRDAGKMPNTISYYMRNLRAIHNKAIAEKRISKPKENPFEGVYMRITKTMKRALSLEEIKSIYSLDFAKLIKDKKPESIEYKAMENLKHAWWYFGFCFFARGMSFIDMAYLRKTNIRSGFIRYVRKKTGQQIDIRITPEIQNIINNFANETKHSPYIFPIILENGNPPYIQYQTALHSQNSKLKHLAALAGIDKKISTHWARHSWATIGKLANLPISVISECLGHTSEKTTRIYLDSLDNSLLDAANDTIISAIACRPPVSMALYNQ